MSERYLDLFAELTNQGKSVQGLSVKFPFMESFYPVQDVQPIPGEADMLKVVISTRPAEVYTPTPDLNSFGSHDLCIQNYFVHKSQVIFRTCERYAAPSDTPQPRPREPEELQTENQHEDNGLFTWGHKGHRHLLTYKKKK